MTTEEIKFFKEFEIPSIKRTTCKVGGNGDFCPYAFSHTCAECDMSKEEITYPRITADIILALECVLCKKGYLNINVCPSNSSSLPPHSGQYFIILHYLIFFYCLCFSIV